MSRELRCSQCGGRIRPGRRYYTILGETYCEEHGDEWLQDEIADRFQDLRDELAELAGVFIGYWEEA